MKTDYYLHQCLEQASLSPLRCRHGCIVVKGGKIIGKGFNDYRSGFDGGALKTGRIPASPYPLGGPGPSDLKPKRQSKPKPHLTSSAPPRFDADASDRGAGHHANTSLTMHSEMMAINSALTRSGLASNVKTYFKLSACSKRNRLRRNHTIRSYVERVCLESQGQHLQQRPCAV